MRNNPGIAWAAISLAVVPAIFVGIAAAQSSPASLSANALAQCAQQVQTLRAESTRLNQKNVEFERRRADIQLRSSQRGRDYRLPGQNQTAADIDTNRQNLRLNTDIVQFNNEISQFRVEVADLNAIKQNYDQRCANRSYRRSDFATLTPAARAAMKAGLGDVRVPYTESIEPLPESQ